MIGKNLYSLLKVIKFFVISFHQRRMKQLFTDDFTEDIHCSSTGDVVSCRFIITELLRAPGCKKKYSDNDSGVFRIVVHVQGTTYGWDHPLQGNTIFMDDMQSDMMDWMYRPVRSCRYALADDPSIATDAVVLVCNE
jgi:hypothetical protein